MDYTTQMDAARKGIITREMGAGGQKREEDGGGDPSVGGRGPGGHSLQPGP